RTHFARWLRITLGDQSRHRTHRGEKSECDLFHGEPLFFPLALGPHPQRELTLIPRLGFTVLGSVWPPALTFLRRRGPPSARTERPAEAGHDVLTPAHCPPFPTDLILHR